MGRESAVGVLSLIMTSRDGAGQADPMSEQDDGPGPFPGISFSQQSCNGMNKRSNILYLTVCAT